MNTGNVRSGAAAIGAALAILAATPAGRAQEVFYVDDDAPPGGDGRSWTGALSDLQIALAKAKYQTPVGSTVEVRVAEGLYTPSTRMRQSDSFVLFSAISLVGGFAGRGAANPDANDPAAFVTTLSGDLGGDDGPGAAVYGPNSFQVVRIEAGDALTRVRGFTITRGGAAIEMWDSVNCAVSDCRIVSNAGTGVYAQCSGIVIDRCEFVDNGAAASFYGNSNVLSRCVVRSNGYSNGPVIESSASIDAPLRMISCLVAGNSNQQVFSFWGYAELINCTVVANSRPFSPGMNATVRLNNCIFWGNAAGSGSNVGSLLASSSCVQLSQPVGEVAGVIRVDPRFVDPLGPDGTPGSGDEDYRLRSDSPCINAGAGALYLSEFPGEDVAGSERVQGISIDMGAFEYEGARCPGDVNNSGTVTAQDIYEFLAAWTLALPAADFNLDARVSVQDIYDFLAAWSAGCT